MLCSTNEILSLETLNSPGVERVFTKNELTDLKLHFGVGRVGAGKEANNRLGNLLTRAQDTEFQPQFP